jgi:large subunit ribosomal protein L11
MGEIVELEIEGGNASKNSTLVSKLNEYKLDLNKIIKEINEKTKEHKGIQIPIKIEIDPKTKAYEIDIKPPPLSVLIKKEVGIEKLKISEEDKAKGVTSVGNLKFEQIVKIAKIKMPQFHTKNLRSAIKQVIGTCVSMPITIEEKSPKEILKEVDEGKWDDYIK